MKFADTFSQRIPIDFMFHWGTLDWNHDFHAMLTSWHCEEVHQIRLAALQYDERHVVGNSEDKEENDWPNHESSLVCKQ